MTHENYEIQCQCHKVLLALINVTHSLHIIYGYFHSDMTLLTNCELVCQTRNIYHLDPCRPLFYSVREEDFCFVALPSSTYATTSWPEMATPAICVCILASAEEKRQRRAHFFTLRKQIHTLHFCFIWLEVSLLIILSCKTLFLKVTCPAKKSRIPL